jgi:heat shock protein HtpX
VTELVLGILANCIVMWFSRQREFRADAGGALYAGRDNMIAALERLKSGADAPLPDALAAFGIKGGRGTGIGRFFTSHPPLEDRIAALEADRFNWAQRHGNDSGFDPYAGCEGEFGD